MLSPIESLSGDAPVSDTSCVERGVWSPIPVAPPAGALHLKLKNVDVNEAQAIRERGVISFHAVGCSGNFKDHLPGSMVAKAMAAQVNNPRVYFGNPAAVGASFLFHLGDLVYKDEDQADPDGKDQATMYNAQFYGQFANYNREIFAIPGNHDGKTSVKKKKWGILHFLQNFCASKRERSPDDLTNAGKRLTMIQPYPYWLFETAVCYVVALYTNDINGGQLDDPMGTEQPQYQWLVDTLKGIKEAANGKAVFLALHYPPYSGGANFRQRGNPNLGPTQRRPDGELLPLGNILQQAFHESGQYPDVVLSAHAHFYQRITYTYASGRQIPYLVCGSGGHGPVEKISTTCSGASIAPRSVPFDAILPVGLAIPNGDTVKVTYYNDEDFGFLRFTVEKNQKIVIGEFFSAFNESNPNGNFPILSDSFVLRLENHTISQ
jgi:Calcineurin-like phosphoesterase